MSGRLGGYQLPRWGQPKSAEEMQTFNDEGNRDYTKLAGNLPPLNSGLGTGAGTETDFSGFNPHDLAGRIPPNPSALPDRNSPTGTLTSSPDLTPNPNHPGDVGNPLHPGSTTPSTSTAPLPPTIDWATPGWTSRLSPLDQSTYQAIGQTTDPYKLGQYGSNPLSAGYWNK